MKRYISFLLALTLLLCLCACTTRPEQTQESPEPSADVTNGPKTSPKPTATPKPTPTPVVETEPPYRDFFTGEGLDKPDYTRPFAVMINNINVAQPQCGIGDADIIYEVLAEGGITRMMAIFSNIKDAGKIGSMRSIRTYYVDIAMSYGAVAVHAGYSQQAYQRIVSNGVNNIDGVTGSYSSKTFYRDPDRMYAGLEHSMFTSGERLYDCAEGLEYPLTVGEDYETGLNFVKDGTPEKGSSAEKIEVDFSGYKSSKLTYHEDTGLYTMVQHGSDYVDGNNDESVTFTNVIVLSAATSVIDSAGRLDVTLTGEGTGWYANGGKVVEIKWSREGLTDHFVYTLTDGTPLEIGVGKSYIAIIATNGGEAIFE